MTREARRGGTDIKGSLLNWLHARHANRPGMDPLALRTEAVDGTLRWARKLFGEGKYFPLEIRGWENVPATTAMLVSNHSGGTSIPDAWGFLVAWYERFGTERPLHPLAHDMILSTQAVGSFFEARGVLRANSGVALSALKDHGRDLLVMPGGDLDTWRPYSARYEVRFGQRLGYVRTALRAGVPIVPMANAGAHETFYVLTDGRAIARALRLPQIARAEIFPIHFSLPWGLCIGPWPHIPLPARLRYRIGDAIVGPRQYAPGEPIPDALVREIDAAARGTIQALLHDLRDSDPRKKNRAAAPGRAPTAKEQADALERFASASRLSSSRPKSLRSAFHSAE
jgi:1-acyl-sn-glycerol-3-phosphate acyltransferase